MRASCPSGSGAERPEEKPPPRPACRFAGLRRLTHSVPSQPCPPAQQRVPEQRSPRALPSPETLLTSWGKAPQLPRPRALPSPETHLTGGKASPFQHPPTRPGHVPKAWAATAPVTEIPQATSASSGQGTCRRSPDPSPVRVPGAAHPHAPLGAAGPPCYGVAGGDGPAPAAAQREAAAPLPAAGGRWWAGGARGGGDTPLGLRRHLRARGREGPVPVSAAGASRFSRQFILINLLNNKNTSEENYVHFIQFVLTFVRKSLIEKCSNQLENNPQ